jgi:biotin carboxyl carrier protein
MLNDREDKYDNDDSEYHFTDEDVSYEVETESPKASPSAGANGLAALINRLGQSKRILISLGVFVVLIFLVYKMVAPTSPKVDIPVPVVAQQTNQVGVPQSQSTAPMQATMPQSPAAPNAVMAQSQSSALPAPNQPVAVNNEQSQQQQPEQAAAMQQPSAAMMPESSTSNMNTATEQPAMMVQQPMPQEAQNNSSAITMPPVMPVQSSVPAQPYQTPVQPSQMEQIVNQNEKLMSQLQADYTQKANDYAAQNRELQEQMQSLNTRVASMESQMNQLVQALTKQTQSATQAPAVAEAPVPTNQPANEMSSSRYSVQAIIPGRAWLRSDSGEAVTVAEGDTIKDLGKVTKIDPYDGVVEINTGSKVISLSYGSGS